MNQTQRLVLNPLEVMEQLRLPREHVRFDPTLRHSTRSYYRREASRHDGTLIFSLELLRDLLLPIAAQVAYNKLDYVYLDLDRPLRVNYRVGPIKVAIVYGLFDLPSGRYPGQREAVRMNVVPEYIY